MAKRAAPFTTKLRSMVIGNWKNKSVALFLALVVWAYAFSTRIEEGELEFRVQIVPKDPQKWAVLRVDEPGRAPFDGIVLLKVNTQQSRLQELMRRRDLTARIEVDSTAAIDLRSPVHYERESLKGVAILDADPREVVPVVEEVQTESRPIAYRILEEGGAQDAVIELDPKEVVVSAPKSLIGDVRVFVELDFADVENLNETIEADLLVDPKSRLVRVESAPEKVRVKVHFADDSDEQQLKVPVRFALPPEARIGIEAERVVTLKFRATRAVLEELVARIDRYEVRAIIDVPESKLDFSANPAQRKEVSVSGPEDFDLIGLPEGIESFQLAFSYYYTLKLCQVP